MAVIINFNWQANSYRQCRLWHQYPAPQCAEPAIQIRMECYQSIIFMNKNETTMKIMEPCTWKLELLTTG